MTWPLEDESVQFSSVQLLSHVRLFVTPWTTVHQASLSITNSRSPPKPMSIKSMMPSKHFFLCYSLLLMTENKCWTNDKTTVSNNLSCPSRSGLVFSDSGSFPCFSSVQSLVISNSLRPLELKHTRPPCPLPTPGVHSNSCPSSRWYHPAISSSVLPFSSCPQSLPASESFPMSQLFAWGGQSAGASALASFLPKKSQGWSPSEWTGWISLQFKGLSRVFSNTTAQKLFFGVQSSLQSNSHIHTWLLEKP